MLPRGSALVIGGTGAIGTLAAGLLWQQTYPEVHLMGRTGRSENKGHENAAGVTCLSRCDASSSEECHGALEELRHTSSYSLGEAWPCSRLEPVYLMTGLLKSLWGSLRIFIGFMHTNGTCQALRVIESCCRSCIEQPGGCMMMSYTLTNFSTLLCPCRCCHACWRVVEGRVSAEAEPLWHQGGICSQGGSFAPPLQPYLLFPSQGDTRLLIHRVAARSCWSSQLRSSQCSFGRSVFSTSETRQVEIVSSMSVPVYSPMWPRFSFSAPRVS